MKQKRLDEPTAEGARFLFPKDCELPLGIAGGEDMLTRVKDRKTPIAFVEGTRQHFAAASAALRITDETKRIAVVGFSGVWNWKQNGRPLRHFDDIELKDREVYVCVDADVAVNRQVWEGANA
ncbi:MAG: hypothetical protein KDC39_15885, partial [Actinobacteria bacterium]|nr:hypothetical protein [Actinomycetota bacterium]